MSAATIIFTDIVGFSLKPTDEQKRLVNSLTEQVADQIDDLLNPEPPEPNVIALPTGDGIALAFLHNSERTWNRSTIFQLALTLHKWAESQSLLSTSVELRIGIHVGVVELIKDINGSLNICGNTINYSQRVMDAARAKQTLLSADAFREYVGEETTVCTEPPFCEALTAEFVGPIEVFAKHDLQIQVYKLTLEPEQTYCSNEDPEAKHLMVVGLTSLPKKVAGDFSDRIAKAKHIAFIQYTGERFITAVENDKIKLSKQLKRFWVFMPDPDYYEQLTLSTNQAAPELVRACVQKWRDFFKKQQQSYPNVDFKLGLFKEPPYLGASFIDWERPKGMIHISPNVWNIAAAKCPGYDLLWLGQNPSEVYETYVEALQYLNQTTTSRVDENESDL